jgi:hypothetical protein
MAIPAQASIDETNGSSAQYRCRKHLQRLIRKVQHVLVVKHWIDDLRQSANYQGRERSLKNAYVFPPYNFQLESRILSPSPDLIFS